MDFSFYEDDININEQTHDIKINTDHEYKIQVAYNRLKSVSTEWFNDNTGADLESLLGKPCDIMNIENGKVLIFNALTQDDLWKEEDFYIKANVIDNTKIIYYIYFKIQTSTDTYSYEMDIDLDLNQGVNIRYGWEPRR